MSLLDVVGIPFRLQREGRPSGHEPHVSWRGVTLTSGPRADLFLDPQGSDDPPDAERFVAPVEGSFQLSARTTVDFKNTFDSGVLIGYVDESTWFKLCAELDPEGTARVVSVVTRQGASDDSNGWPMNGPSVYLRIARLGRAFALHASDDGDSWSLVRYFSLGIPDDQPVKVGMLAQSPTGEGTTVRFENLRFSTELLAEVRDGS
jgi:regulation of enolase protein 1 (concanavalin A-like superfamily)